MIALPNLLVSASFERLSTEAISTARLRTRFPTVLRRFSRANGTRARLCLGALLATLTLVACNPDTVNNDESGSTAGQTDGGVTTDTGSDSGGSSGDGNSAPLSPTDGNFVLDLPTAAVTLTEGEAPVSVRIAIDRSSTHDGQVQLTVDDTAGDADGLAFSFENSILDAGQNETTLSVSMPIAARPRQPGSRTLSIIARDGSGNASQTSQVPVEFAPTNRPDIYLLAGQSNMLGSSDEDARLAGAGQPDAPDARIFQLDVTINDQMRFPTQAAFTDIARIAPTDQRIVTALDPLHDIYDRGKNTKSGTTIGLGLSFAKAALSDTTANIVLVPTAWSDTGFCTRDSNRFEGMGWFGTAPDSDEFAGTLLHDRAVARANLAIAETGGILRGILWHQGEADSDDLVCGNAYADNLAAMVASLRSSIAPDARGAAARGADADIPFIVGTMSKGADGRAPALAPFGEAKALVDSAHRNVAQLVSLSSVVDADDLVPSNGYPCGQGSCIHFGPEALRELGARYYERLSDLLSGS